MGKKLWSHVNVGRGRKIAAGGNLAGKTGGIFFSTPLGGKLEAFDGDGDGDSL